MQNPNWGLWYPLSRFFASHNSEFKNCAKYKILATQNCQFKIFENQNPERKILEIQNSEFMAFQGQNPELKILEDQNPEFTISKMPKSWIQDFGTKKS